MTTTLETTDGPRQDGHTLQRPDDARCSEVRTTTRQVPRVTECVEVAIRSRLLKPNQNGSEGGLRPDRRASKGAFNSTSPETGHSPRCS